MDVHVNIMHSGSFTVKLVAYRNPEPQALTRDSPARATIKSIARDLGISHMTVSRALSGSVHVNAGTRQTIIEHARSVGYVRSSAASVMRGDPTAIVGLLLPNIINEFYARFANHLSTLCAKAGLDLVIHLTNDDWHQEDKLLVRLQSLQARIVLRVPAPRGKDQPVNCLNDLGLINLIRIQDDHDSVGSLMIDDGPSIKAAVEHLAGRGHQRIAYIGAAEVLSSGRNRLQAYSEALGSCGLSLDTGLVCTSAPGFEMGRDHMKSLLNSRNIPDAVVCGGFEISNGALETCLSAQIDMPKQLGFVGYGDPAYYRWVSGGVTTISLSEYRLACEAIRMIESGTTVPALPVRSVPTELVLRHSA